MPQFSPLTSHFSPPLAALHYNSLTSTWLSVDPLSDKYPSVSPYAYCGNNPVRLVDKDGREIWILGEDGLKITYSPNMKYNGNDASVKTKIGVLNQMNTTKSGSKLINELCNAENVYTITDNCVNGPSEAYFCANDGINGGTGGMIVTNGNNDLSTISHELFHGYQDEKGQGGTSIHNEVEAMIFEFSVMIQSGGGPNPIKDNNAAYNELVDKLFFKYTNDNMQNVIGGFKLYARGRDTYQSYPLRKDNQMKSLIKDFYPLF